MNVLVLFILGFGVGRGLVVGFGEFFCGLGGFGLIFGLATSWSGHACNVWIEMRRYVGSRSDPIRGVYYADFGLSGITSQGQKGTLDWIQYDLL